MSDSGLPDEPPPRVPVPAAGPWISVDTQDSPATPGTYMLRTSDGALRSNEWSHDMWSDDPGDADVTHWALVTGPEEMP